MNRAGAWLVTVVLVSACGSPETEPSPRPARADASSSAPPPAALPEPPAAPRPNTTPASAGPQLAIDGEGLRLVDGESGRTRPIPFGTPEAQVMTALTGRGAPASSGVNAECGAGPTRTVAWPDGLSLLFQDARLVGWSLDGRSDGGLTTLSGVGVGSTRTALESAYAATIERSSLGVEFQAGDLGGLLSGDGAQATVTHLWAGVTCAFR